MRQAMRLLLVGTAIVGARGRVTPGLCLGKVQTGQGHLLQRAQLLGEERVRALGAVVRRADDESATRGVPPPAAQPSNPSTV